MSKIVFIAPHFDDMELAAGATITKLCEQGHEVIEVALTDSEEGHHGSFNAEEKRAEGLRAAVTLGLKSENVFSKARLFKEILFSKEEWPVSGDGRESNTKWLESGTRFVNKECLLERSVGSIAEIHRVWNALYDMRMEENGSTVVQTVMKIVRAFKPDIVMSVTEDFHTDHRAMGKYVKEGVYQACRRGISGSTESLREPIVLLGSVDMEKPFNSVTHIYSEITQNQLEKKIKALQSYPDFMSEHPENAKSIFSSDMGRDWCLSVARLRGMESGSSTGLSEAFKLDSLRLVLSLDSLI